MLTVGYWLKPLSISWNSWILTVQLTDSSHSVLSFSNRSITTQLRFKAINKPAVMLNIWTPSTPGFTVVMATTCGIVFLGQLSHILMHIMFLCGEHGDWVNIAVTSPPEGIQQGECAESACPLGQLRGPCCFAASFFLLPPRKSYFSCMKSYQIWHKVGPMPGCLSRKNRSFTEM